MGYQISWPVTKLVLMKWNPDGSIWWRRVGEDLGHWSLGCSGWNSKEAERWLRTQSRGKSQETDNACGEAQKRERARPSIGGQRREERKSVPQPAGGIRSSWGRSFATPIKGFLLPALPHCGFLRQKWLCSWVSTGASKQLWVCGLPACSLSPLNASQGPLSPEPFISRVSSDSHWVYSVICFVNCRSQGIIPSWSLLSIHFLFCPESNFQFFFCLKTYQSSKTV